MASFRSLVGATIMALFPPSSSSDRAKRDARRGPTAAPIAVLPVALTSGSRGSSTSASPASLPPITTWARSALAPSTPSPARLSSPSHASAVSGDFSEGFHTAGSPQTSAIAAFHDHTATGKLKAVMTPIGPSGCQSSVSR
jgi:hypothetical protein